MNQPKTKIFIFSDESGLWHDNNDIYVRSWIAVPENENSQLLNKIDEISSIIGCNELTWKAIANNKKFFKEFNDINFRVFITLSSPKDINWNKYKIIKNFDSSIEKFDFGGLSEELSGYIKDRILRDIKNALFLNFFEKYHIDNAKKGIEKVIVPTEYELIYRVDPPQLPQNGWREILRNLNNVGMNLEFPKSEKTPGIQFADIVAGCFRSLFLKDLKNESAIEFYRNIKSKIIRGDSKNPNPNLIFLGRNRRGRKIKM